MPTSSLDLTGLASYELFLRGTLDKIGAFPDALHIGDYKTASNVYTEHTYTPAHREMAESLNTDLYEQLVRGLADGRHKSEAEIRSLIDHGPYLPEDAVRSGLVDDVAYEDELDDKVELSKGTVRFLEQSDYRNVTTASLGLDRGQRIAVIYAVGLISSGASSYDAPQGQVVGSDTLVDYLRKARADTSIKAIVLRIDSPGGSAIASDVIWREVMLTRNVKPVIASMSDVAASGGYYIAMPASAIVAQPATLTGSIGVVMVKFVIDGTLKKLGLNMEHVQQGRYADLYSPVRPFSPDERARCRSRCRRPTTRSSRRRRPGATRRRRKSTRSGRAACGPGGRPSSSAWWTSSAGSIVRLRIAKARAKIPQDAEVELVVYPPHKSIYEIVANPFGRSDGATALAALLGLEDPRALQTLTAPLQIFRRGEPLALMPNVFVR